jgi:hypothetical protein
MSLTWETSHISANFPAEQIYSAYCEVRLDNPQVDPEFWADVFPNAAAMEEKFILTLLQKAFGELEDA